jgi:hypothetical protein
MLPRVSESAAVTQGMTDTIMQQSTRRIKPQYLPLFFPTLSQDAAIRSCCCRSIFVIVVILMFFPHLF